MPTKTSGDLAHAGAKALIGMIPGVGGAAAELFSFAIGPPLERRRDQWLQALMNRLEELESAGLVSVKELQMNEAFLDAVVQTTRLALATRHTQKLNALMGAVINSALQTDLDDTDQHMFIRMVDEFTPAHLALLRVLDNPVEALGDRAEGYRRSLTVSLRKLIADTIPALAENKDLLSQLARELELRGMVDVGSLSTMMTGRGVLSSRTTPRGKEFMLFITDAR